jgi:NAD(P)H dehydrogenase (quinone)
MKVLIVYYSLYGHTYRRARAVEKGAFSVPGIEVVFRRADELEAVLKATAESKHV